MSDIAAAELIRSGLWLMLAFSAILVIFSWVALFMLTPGTLEGMSEARRLLLLRHKRRMAAHLLRSILFAIPVFPLAFITAVAAFNIVASGLAEAFFYITLGFFALWWLVLMMGVSAISLQILFAHTDED